MLIVIISDDYYYLKGSEAWFRSCGASTKTFQVSDYDQFLNDIELNHCFSGLVASLYVIAVEDDLIRHTVCEELDATAGDVCMVLDFPVDSFIQGLTSVPVFSKKAILSMTLPLNKFIHNGFSRKHSPAKLIKPRKTRRKSNDLEIFQYVVAGLDMGVIAGLAGCSSKYVYARRQSFLEKHGLARTNAFSVLLLKRIFDFVTYMKSRHQNVLINQQISRAVKRLPVQELFTYE